MTRNVTNDAANPDKTTPVVADKLMIIDTETEPDSLKEITLTNLMKLINGLTADTSPDVADTVVTYDASAAAPKQVTLSNLLKIINGLTADSSPDRAADYVATYDASASAPKKVLLSNLGAYSLHCICTAFNPLDSTTYYLGSLIGDPTTTAGRRRVYIPRAGSIVRADIFSNFVAGSSEAHTMSLRLNDTTDTTLSSAINLSSAPFALSVTGLSIAVAAGDYFEIKWVTPAWVTNPTAVNISVQLFVQ